jgi:DNA polymerase-3 subunit delta
MIETFTGSNDFARTQALRARVKTFVQEHGDFAVERLDGESTPAEQMRASVESLPFLTPRKLVILREPSKQKLFTENIVDILKAVSESTDVIIVEPKLDKRLSYYKTLKKDTTFQEFTELDANGLARWAAAYAKEQSGSLSAADAKLIVDRLGINQQMMQLELDKLVAYDPKITKQTIELLTDRLPQSTVFELLDAAFAGNLQRAMQLYKEQRELKVEPQAIIAMLAWQLHIVAVVKAADKRPADEIAKAAKLNPFVVRKSQTLARKLTLAQLKQLIAELLALDMRLKRTATDADDATQLYLVRLAQ